MDSQEMQTLVGMILSGVQDLQGTSGREAGRSVRGYTYDKLITFAAQAAVNTVMTDVIVISAEADFVCVRVLVSARLSTGQAVGAADDLANAAANEAGTGDGDVPFLIQLTDGSGDRLWHSQPVDAGRHYGPQNREGGKLERPRRLAATSSVQVDLTNLKQAAAGVTWLVRISLKGYKVGIPGRS